ncbi:TPA: hypothetical protein IYE33_001740 [Enterococcus faecium]|uniref:4-fold beta flower protein n=1 Tax=Enterococcus faecium TaxID=1352 RepID=UPI000CF22FC9|nr:hypothetical protein [Enterococcus faecium]EBA1164872.1 hypothetical protein [Salmonella enterica subsp. enterica]NTP94926.1 hypothetical protein [Enterococcus faecium]PQG05685.1 hypothetical protein CUS51_00815 [Enterococcus faecium]HAQ8375011.1 hypothetical protein [Enterococcus faecium]HAQ8537723.1 hypothetical protein [Enterococcus faecium]
MDYYDKNGYAFCYIGDNDEIYSWDGKHIGFKNDQEVYLIDGTWVGFSLNNYIFDENGYVVLYNDKAVNAPTPNVPTFKSIPEIPSIHGIPEIAPVHPIASYSWSSKSPLNLFKQ